MAQILITGGSGFIGTHLAERLREASHAVRVLDIQPPAQKIEGVEYQQGDIRDRRAIENALEGVDTVFHLAALVSVPICREKPEESESINVGGTRLLLEEIGMRGKKGRHIRTVFSSSAAVYGNLGIEHAKLAESLPLPRPLSEYAAQKIQCEKLLRQFSLETGAPTLSFRFFNVYGEGQDPHSPYSGVLSIFAERIRKGLPLVIYGTGQQTRDFISVKDIVSGCLGAMSLPQESMTGDVVNLGTGDAVTLLQTAEVLSNYSKMKVPLQFESERTGDVPRSCADVARAGSFLKWHAKTEFQTGMAELLG